jgi:uncharacterized membrane protein YecN with MAPEG domain
MTDKTQPKQKTILVLIEMVGEHYWTVLIVGLAIITSIITYGYFLNQQTILMAGIYAALAFVFGPPAILMVSFLFSSLLDKLRSK